MALADTAQPIDDDDNMSGDFSAKPGDEESAEVRPTASSTLSKSFYTAEEQDAVASSGTAGKETIKLYKRKYLWIIVALLIIGAAVGLALGFTVGKKNSSDASAVVDGGNVVETANQDQEEGSANEGSSKENEVVETAEAGGDVERTATPTGPAVPTPAPVAIIPWTGDGERPTTPVAGAGAGGGNFPTPVPNEIMPWNSPAPFDPTLSGFVSAGSLYEDDGTCDSDPETLTEVVNARGPCSFQLSSTVQVSAPVPTGNNTVEKKLSGGNSDFDGDNAVIVSYNSDGTAGAVWALTKNTAGLDTWEQTGLIQTSESDQLGWGVAMKGNTFVVGAPGQNGTDIALNEGWYWAGRGKALVIGKNDNDEDGGWDMQAVLEPGEADGNADFGSSVDIAPCGCVIAVGAWHDRFNRGSVFVYSKNDDGTWSESQKLAPLNTRRTQSDHLHGNYGYTVAMNDEYLAVKAPYDSYLESYDFYDINRGVVYIYKQNPESGMYEELGRLCAPEGNQVRNHLKDMMFLNQFLLVGAPGKNKVYVFEQKTDEAGVVVGYEKTAELTPSFSAGGVESNFGVRLDSGGGDGSGTNVLVADTGGETSYLFAFEEGVWKEKAKFDGVNTSLSGNSIVEHTPKSFAVDGEEYGGEVNFYDLVCS